MLLCHTYDEHKVSIIEHKLEKNINSMSSNLKRASIWKLRFFSSFICGGTKLQVGDVQDCEKSRIKEQVAVTYFPYTSHTLPILFLYSSHTLLILFPHASYSSHVICIPWEPNMTVCNTLTSQICAWIIVQRLVATSKLHKNIFKIICHGRKQIEMWFKFILN